MFDLSEVISTPAVAIAAVVLVVPAALCALWLLLSCANRKTMVIALLLIAFLLDVVLVEPPSLNVGVQIYPIDVVSLLMLVGLVIAFTWRPLPIKEPVFVLWLLFGLVMAVSLAIGARAHGTTAVVEVRSNWYFWAAGLYCCAVEFDEEEIRRMARWCLWAAYAIVAIAIGRWIGVQAGLLSMKVIEEAGASNEFRAVGSNGAFFVAAAGLVQLLLWMRGASGRRGAIHALVFALFVVVVQHRSVWMAYAAAGVLVLFQARRTSANWLPWMLTLFVFGGMALGVATAFGMFDRLIETLWESAVSVGYSHSTTTDRIFGWEALLEDWGGSPIGTILFGYPYGAGFRRVITGLVIEYSPHNFYVQLLLRVGVVGCALFVVATLSALLHAVRARAASEPEQLLLDSLGIVLLASMVYYVPYQGFHLQGAVTGLAMAQMFRLSCLRASQAREQRATLRPSLGRTSVGTR